MCGISKYGMLSDQVDTWHILAEQTNQIILMATGMMENDSTSQITT